jgi:ribosomal protein S18 acetylase RimI-like enzyme
MTEAPAAPVVVRRATAADVPALGQVASEAYSTYLPRMHGRRPGPLDADYAAAVAGSETWVAVVDGVVVGFLVLMAEDDAMLLENVAVVPALQGRGVGARLLALAEQRATEAGRFRIRLYTHVSMVENQALYERRGYVETHRGGDEGLVRVFYEKWLQDTTEDS